MAYIKFSRRLRFHECISTRLFTVFTLTTWAPSTFNVFNYWSTLSLYQKFSRLDSEVFDKCISSTNHTGLPKILYTCGQGGWIWKVLLSSHSSSQCLRGYKHHWRKCAHSRVNAFNYCNTLSVYQKFSFGFWSLW